MGLWSKKKPPIREYIGPDMPRVFVRAKVSAHLPGRSSDTVQVVLDIAGAETYVQMPRTYAASFPVGGAIRLEVTPDPTPKASEK